MTAVPRFFGVLLDLHRVWRSRAVHCLLPNIWWDDRFAFFFVLIDEVLGEGHVVC